MRIHSSLRLSFIICSYLLPQQCHSASCFSLDILPLLESLSLKWNIYYCNSSVPYSLLLNSSSASEGQCSVPSSPRLYFHSPPWLFSAVPSMPMPLTGCAISNTLGFSWKSWRQCLLLWENRDQVIRGHRRWSLKALTVGLSWKS